MTYFISTDGGSRGNPGPAASAFVVRNEQSEKVASGGFYLGIATNNEAEYGAVIQALKWATHQQDKKNMATLAFTLDSELLVRQLSGQYRIKAPHLQKLAVEIKALEYQLGIPVSYRHVPRERNTAADAIVNDVLDREAHR